MTCARSSPGWFPPALRNASSLAVSRKLGYVLNGVTRVRTRPGEVVDLQHVRLSRGDFRRPEWSSGMTGVPAALRLLVPPDRRLPQ